MTSATTTYSARGINTAIAEDCVVEAGGTLDPVCSYTRSGADSATLFNDAIGRRLGGPIVRVDCNQPGDTSADLFSLLSNFALRLNDLI